MEENSRPLKRILQHIEKYSYYILPHRFYTSEDGSIRIKVIFWKGELVNYNFDFGITVQCRGKADHQMFNIKQSVTELTEVYIQEQLERVNRILARPLQPLCGTLGRNKTDMMQVVGMDKKVLGIEGCCVCGKETALQTYICCHNICVYCLSKVDKCPMCRNENISCLCCINAEFESENEDESDDEFSVV